MVNRQHLYCAFLTSGHSKRFIILPNIHPFIHTPTVVVSATQGNSQLVRKFG